MSQKNMQDVNSMQGQRVLEGTVVSDKMQKTVVVEVTRTGKHLLLGKVIKSTKKYKVHDEQEEAQQGDWVEIVECRPLSKTKHMKLSRVLRSVSRESVV